MDIDRKLVQQIVAAVEDRLRPGEGTDHPAAATVLSDPVVTGELLRQRLVPGVRLIRLSANSILTPTARDLIAQREIECVRDSGQAEATASGWHLLLSGSGVPTPLNHRGERLEDSASTVTRVIELLGSGIPGGVLVLSTDPHRVACLANRSGEIRGAVVAGAEEAECVLRGLGANLIVASPVAVGVLGTRRILESCLVAEPPSAPSDWPATPEGSIPSRGLERK